jgi:hypothetical protein
MVFSASIGLLIALASITAGLLEASLDKTTLADDTALHGVSLLLFVVAPMVALLSLAISLPASYVQWGRPIVGTGFIALLATVVSFGIVIPLFLPSAGLLFVLIVGCTLAISLLVAGIVWRAAMPRPNTLLERSREG